MWLQTQGILRTIVRVYYNEVNIIGIEIFARPVYKAVPRLLFFTHTLVQGEFEILDDVCESVFRVWEDWMS